MVGGGVDGSCAESGENGTAPSALQVIVLGSGGGPDESNTTSFLVRSVAAGWGKGSLVSVDAGVLLSAIERIFRATQPAGLEKREIALPHVLQDGPFKGMELPHFNPKANAAHVLRNLVETCLITHPHMDHISGFVINTAGAPSSKPKKLAGLPFTISALKAHVFNNIIWPNLSDENNGVGMITYNRLVEGGSPALGEGEGKGYVEISDGLSVKVMGVSHGHCIEKHAHRGSGSSTRFPSFDASSMGPGGGGMGAASGLLSPRSLAHHNTADPRLSLLLQQQQAARAESTISTPGFGGGGSVMGGGSMAAARGDRMSMVSNTQNDDIQECVYDSSACFLRDVATGREVLIFGDVEPDEVSLSKRNKFVWAEAAPKIASGKLTAILIECSYDDSQAKDRLYGHMTPKYISREMAFLADEVAAARILLAREGRKRKRSDLDIDTVGVDDMDGVGTTEGANISPTTRRKTASRSRYSAGTGDDPVSPKTIKPPRGASLSGDDLPPPLLHTHSGMGHHPLQYTSTGTDSPRLSTPTAELSLRDVEIPVAEAAAAAAAATSSPPLAGLKIVIIHVKDRMDDGPPVGDIIMKELRTHEAESRLGCEYILSYSGQSLYF